MVLRSTDPTLHDLRRRPSSGRRPRARAGTALALAAAAVLASPAPAGAAPACGPGQVAVVIDFAGVEGRGVSRACVPGAEREYPTNVLDRRAPQIGVAPPRYDGWFVCALDGYPAPPTCATTATNGAVAYWSYWLGTCNTDGTVSWAYSTRGAAARRIDPDVVEGWRWVPDGNNAPPAESGSRVCAPPPPPTTAPPPPAPDPSTSDPDAPADAGAATSRPTSTRDGTTAEARPDEGAQHPEGEDGDGTTTTTVAPADTTLPAADGDETSPTPRESAADASMTARHDDPGSATATVATAGLVGALAVAALVLRRRRTPSDP